MPIYVWDFVESIYDAITEAADGVGNVFVSGFARVMSWALGIILICIYIYGLIFVDWHLIYVAGAIVLIELICQIGAHYRS